MSSLIGLTNREASAGIWLGILVIAVFAHRPTRASAVQLVKLLTRRPFTTVFASAALYIGGCVWLMAEVGLWTWSNLKTTVLWALTFAAVTIFSANRVDEDHTYFRK